MTVSADLKKPVRNFLPAGFVLTDWDSLEPYFQDLERRPLDTRAALEKWLLDMSELEAVGRHRMDTSFKAVWKIVAACGFCGGRLIGLCRARSLAS